jgi:hypothetical protein
MGTERHVNIKRSTGETVENNRQAGANPTISEFTTTTPAFSRLERFSK